MLEHLLEYIHTAPPIAVYTILLLFPFIENIFPPSPSDLIILVGGTMIGKSIDFIPAVLITAVSSELGFILLYYLGTQTDRKIIHAGKLKFISADALQIAEDWFAKYGFVIILFNRFISGVRSVIAFFAGLSELPFKKTVILSSISSLLWHIVLLSLGWLFGAHVQKIDHIISVYGTVLTIAVLVIVIIFGARYYLAQKGK